MKQKLRLKVNIITWELKMIIVLVYGKYKMILVGCRGRHQRKRQQGTSERSQLECQRSWGVANSY